MIRSFPLPLAADPTRRLPSSRRIRLFAMWLIGMIYFGSLFRTGYYLIKAALA